jgi:hypothetical protein
MEAARAAEAAAQEEVPSPPEPTPEPTPAGGNTPPEPAAEDRKAAPEQAEEQEESAAPAQQPMSSDKTKVQTALLQFECYFTCVLTEIFDPKLSFLFNRYLAYSYNYFFPGTFSA